MELIKSREFAFLNNSEEISYSIYFNADPDKISCVVALGSAQVSRLPKMIASSLDVKAAVIQGLPHWHAKSDGSGLEQFTLEFANQSIGQATSQAQTTTLIAESQAAPGAVLYALNNPGIIKSLILIQPLGLNAKSFIESDLPIIKEFEKRIRANAKYQIISLLSDWRLIYNYFMLLKTRFSSDFSDRFAAHYEIGLQSDITSSLNHVATLMPVHIILGENDQIFRPEEIIHTIKKENIRLASLSVVKDIPHSPLVSRKGRKLLSKAALLAKVPA